MHPRANRIARRLLPCAALAIAGPMIAAIGAQAVPSSAAADSVPTALEVARAAWERHPTNADSIIWYGRRVGYTGDFAKAVAIYTEGLRHHPDEPRLLRHRGHRYVSLREFDKAIADLTRARTLVAGTEDEVEPDGQPNARGIPTSTLHGNIRYHLALAHFVKGDFAAALPIWAEDARLARNHDHRVAATYWQVLTLAHLGRLGEVRSELAQVRADWDIIENGSYHRLLLWMQGEIPERDLLGPEATPLERQTVGNGIGQWFLGMGQRSRAEKAFEAVLATGPSASFGFIAAEAALRRLR
jgi:tetratricopeptide (TPR) repeat protein